MPALPFVVGGSVIALVLLSMGDKKKPEPKPPVEPVVNKPDVPIVPLPIPPVPPIHLQPVTPAPTAHSYVLAGDANDMSPAALITAWTSKAPSMDLMNALADANPSLQRQVIYDNVVYYPDPSSGVSDSMAAQKVTLPAGQSPNVSVDANAPAGTSWPNNAMPGFRGHWQTTGNQTPTFSPWKAGQTVIIPASWGAPQSSALSGRYTSV